MNGAGSLLLLSMSRLTIWSCTRHGGELIKKATTKFIQIVVVVSFSLDVM